MSAPKKQIINIVDPVDIEVVNRTARLKMQIDELNEQYSEAMEQLKGQVDLTLHNEEDGVVLRTVQSELHFTKCTSESIQAMPNWKISKKIGLGVFMANAKISIANLKKLWPDAVTSSVTDKRSLNKAMLRISATTTGRVPTKKPTKQEEYVLVE